ncbi:hypothetical protein [Actinocorallia sp. A-T 12471]|uniref:hypothetical protein n=1 Tax=Actinocorallia sp. A-T 12471 TaxID=3089813 RepID=UPI0029CD20C6|nr:hypothetical protein [Actinocorallia sp. A-T 12471]MDX6744018.1 hypothetical protein [Actinocorallia sp. A-T 12471]
MSDPSPPGRRLLRAVSITLGVSLLAAGIAALAYDLTRAPTPAESKRATERELHDRWRRLDAGVLFPAEVNYGADGSDARVARRVGIAEPATCRDALDPKAADLLAPFGCETVLRATYVDASGTEVVTVGVAPLRDLDAARQLVLELSAAGGSGLRAVSFPGTVAASFTDARRQASAVSVAGRHLLFQTGGWLDDRPALDGTAVITRFDHGAAVRDGINDLLVWSADDVCKAEGFKC